MTARERLSILAQLLGVGTLLFIGGGWLFGNLGYSPRENVFSDTSKLILTGLPIIITLGLIAGSIRCLWK